jgi:FK506-binding protein 8
MDEKKIPPPKTPARNVNDESFVKILGNKSLQKKIIEYGEEGDSSRPINGQMVTISYEAYLHEDPIQRLIDHSESMSFILGDGDVISGLDMAVCLMDRNERAEIIIEARHAFGSIGKYTRNFFAYIYLVFQSR